MILTSRSYFACPTWGAKFIEEPGVNFFKFIPLGWDIIFIIDRFDRADRFAGATINALIRLYVEHPITLIDAIDWALFDTGLILNIHARKRDHICHERLLTTTFKVLLKEKRTDLGS
jgi:hypothetical protein